MKKFLFALCGLACIFGSCNMENTRNDSRENPPGVEQPSDDNTPPGTQPPTQQR